jgi:hypothetical protein
MTYFNSAAEMNEALASGSMHITATGDVPPIGLMAHKGPAKCPFLSGQDRLLRKC